MLESLVEWMSYPLYYAFDGAAPPERTGASHATIYPYGPFRAGDGKTVMLGIQNEREWSAFCEKVLGQPQLADDARFASVSRRASARDILQPILLEAFSRLSGEELVRRLDAAQIANARVNDMREVWEHPQLRARARWVEVDTPAGRIAAPVPPGVSSREARMGPIPALGEHTDAILAELGFTAENISSLRAAKAI
jgi:itaconate CoA-transferase